VTVGNNCKIQNNVSVFKGVTLEDGVFCGFTNVYNPRAEIRKTDQIRPTLVKKGAGIGADAAVICGNTVGRYAFVGAVNKNVPDYASAAGNPVRQIGWVCECGERLADDLKWTEKLGHCRINGAFMETAKILTDGYRQTVLLPETYRLYGNEVYIKKITGGILLIPKDQSLWDIWEQNLMKYEEPFMTGREQSSKQQERPGLDALFD